MATAIITPDQDTIVAEIDVAAPPERVFKAISDADDIRRRSPQLDVFEMDVRLGGRWRLEMRHPEHYHGFSVIRHQGEILELDPPRLLVYTWLANFHKDPKRRSVVRWELSPTKSGTHVKLTHSGLAAEADARTAYAGGWPGVLEEIKTAAEKQSTQLGEAMATTSITPDQDAVVSEIHIAASPERVFQALIDPKQVMQWWTSPECQIESFDFEPRRGGRWRYDTRQSKTNVNGVTKFHCEGKVLEYDPPRLLAYTWIANWHDDRALRTVVRWDLSPAGAGTKVKVTHSGLAKLPVARQSYSGGWPGVVGQLKKFVEKR